MRDTLLHKWLPGLLVALAVALPGLALGAPNSAADHGPQPVQGADHSSLMTSSRGDAASYGIPQGEYANYFVAGPYYYFSTACEMADFLGRLGFCTDIRLVDGWWYVLYW